MITQQQDERAAVARAGQLAEAAATLRGALAGPGAVEDLPLTLARVGETVDELASGMLVLAESVAKSSTASPDLDHLSPEARALCWHLHELAARLRAARASVDTAQDWSVA